jgi:Na+/glutamate symporter
MPVKVILAIVIVVVALVALFFIYDWMGSHLLDSGGTIS